MGALAILLLAAPLQGGPADASKPAELDSAVASVTVYPGAALVRRVAEAPAGGGLVALRGLPGGLDADAVRVRCEGAEVVSVEARERLEAAAPEARIAALRAEVAELEDRLAALADEGEVLDGLRRHVDALFALEERAFAASLAAGEERAGAAERLEWLGARLDELAASRRELAARRGAAERELADVKARLGRLSAGAGTPVVDLLVELAGAGDGPAALEAEYLVGDAGWTPAYDLRATQELDRVELVYRARVRQRTGEDWDDVELLLSTAEPRRGARGPEPPRRWLDLASKAADRWFLGQGPSTPGAEVARGVAVARPGSSPPRAEVLGAGPTVRYRLPRRETVESRDEAATVLIGRADLAVEPEHVVVPARDTTVWVRARATNDSGWVLLPGRAAVYFGRDFLGHAAVPAVQRGQELLLHLGPDPGLVVERIVLSEETEESGLFSSKATLRTRLRFRIRNEGGLTARPDGAVRVTLHETIPRSRDERVEVELEHADPAPTRSERFDTLREEKGVETWRVLVPRGAERVIELETEIRYPEDLELVRQP